ncbi:response regulator receiver protein [Haladaptatus pallidirubidus]|uniref:response regulator receiver protein n=1 Tax=Haladaptatus pallidirubidus TaxID=1008152 RepID=UPI001D0F573F|nr:response regulator receiver protein [Haladaptatus pallidirubidus]
MAETDIESEKTDRLRKIFMEVADDPTVTESQHESHGTLHHSSASTDTLADIIREMQADYGFQTSLSTDELVQLVQLYYEDYSDTAIARELGNPSRDKTVTRARIHLHLFRETDFEAPFDLDQLRNQLQSDTSPSEIAETVGVSTSTIRRYRRILDAEQTAQENEYRYQQRFETVLDESDESHSIRESIESGLDDALDMSPGKN